MRKALGFVLSGVGLIAVCGAALTVLFPSALDRRAIAISALVALMVQMLTFSVARGIGPQHVIAGWGLGAALRLVVLTVFALLVVDRVGLPLPSAIISLAVFLFVTTVIEPLFLSR
jgi:hypothetical protein